MYRSTIRVRVALAYAAFLVSSVICVAERHVHIVLAEPATYSNFLHHRCGRLFLACLAWAVVETTLMAQSARSIRPIQS